MTLVGRKKKPTGVIDFEAICKEQDMRCMYCQCLMVLPYRHWNPLSATKDHVIPLSKGGEHSQSNIVAACLRCNGDKADLTLDEWCGP